MDGLVIRTISMNKPYLVLYPNGSLAERHLTRLGAVSEAKKLSKEKGVNFVVAYDLKEVK